MTNQPAQREILFRVIRNGKIVGYERLYETQWKWRHANSDRWIDGFYGNAPDLIRDQYTGITDKNGVKVFEGDKYTVANHITYEVQYRAESEHQYEKAYACFCLAVPERMVIPFDEYAVKNGAVTGNIHDKNEQEGEK